MHLETWTCSSGAKQNVHAGNQVSAGQKTRRATPRGPTPGATARRRSVPQRPGSDFSPVVAGFCILAGQMRLIRCPPNHCDQARFIMLRLAIFLLGLAAWI